jgi:YidC/Oxa1 family membrane protein insertase
VLTDAPDALVSAQQMLPLLSAVGLLVAGAFVPVALLLYWVCNGAWTLGQSAAIARWAPTPGSAAALAASSRPARGGRISPRRR